MGPPHCQGRLLDSLRMQASPDLFTHFSDVSAPGASGGSTSPPREAGGGKGTKPSVSGFLQSSFLSSQERRPLAPYYRPLHPELLRRCHDVQDGDAELYKGIHPTGSLGSFPRSLGCLLPRSHSSGISEVSQILRRRRGLPIQGYALRSLYGSPSFYQTHGRSGFLPSPSRISTSSVLRRLASAPGRLPPSSPRSGGGLGRDIGPRPSSQSHQVGISSVPKLLVCGNELSDQQEPSQGPSRTCPCDSPPSGHVSDSDQGSSPSLSFSDRRAQCRGRSGGIGQVALTPHPILPLVPLVTQQGQSVPVDSSSSNTPPLSGMVVGQGPSGGGSDSVPSLPDSAAGNGCQQVGLGCSPRAPRSHGVGDLVCSGLLSPHQQSGNESGSSGHFSFPDESPGTLCASVIRQHNSSLLHSQAGGDSFPLPVPGNSAPVLSVPDPSGYPVGQAHSGTSECLSGRLVQTESDASLRVDSSAGGGQHDLLSVRTPHGGPVCNQAQPPAPTLCVPSSGPGSLGSGCSVPGLESSDSLRLPSVPVNSTGSEEGQGVTVPGSSPSTLVASEVMVQRPAGASAGSSPSPPSSSRPLVSERQASSRPRHAPSSRLAVIRDALRKKRFSSRAASLIADARRTSTNKVYNAKWKVFTNWCSARKVNPLDPSMRRIADFLIFLFDKRKLSVSTIKGYRSMISHTLSFRHQNTIGSDSSLSELIRAFELKRPVARSLTPKWDLSCVLWSLTKAPYEPLDQATLQLLTWKTVFLLTLASAKRRSEIHALSTEDGHLRFNADGSVSLLCQTGFLAKTQLPSVAPSPFSIPSLSLNCGRDDADRTLCPVRALKFYLARVKPLRGHRKRLFLPLKGGGDISAASISRWIASTIRKAYSSLSDRDVSHLKVKPHELRALSASWAFVNHTPLEDILQATFWRNASTFSSFYLRSFSRQQDNLFLLGPFVASQTVVSSSSTFTSHASVPDQ